MAQQLILGGVGGIAWNNIKRYAPAKLPSPAAELRDTYRSLCILEHRDQNAIQEVGKMLQDAGIAPLTFKGRALSSFYSPSHIRPTGDLDLVVPVDQYKRAYSTLLDNSKAYFLEPNGEDVKFTLALTDGDLTLQVDLHSDLSRMGIASLHELFEYSVPAPIAKPSEFQAPCLEHHIRIVTIHFLRHGGWRPLWLCDIAALMDAIDSQFRWNLCLGSNPVHSQWVVLAMRLAEQLLGAKTPDYPSPLNSLEPPRWMVRTVEKAWQITSYNPYRHPEFSSVRHFSDKLREIRRRWPNPLQAMTEQQRSFDTRFVLPFQCMSFWRRCWRYLAR